MFITQFSFKVGDKEKHTITFRYSKWMGSVSVKSDGVEIARTRILVMGQAPILNATVGQNEKHNLRFDIRPNGFFFMKPTISTYLDDKLIKDY